MEWEQRDIKSGPCFYKSYQEVRKKPALRNGYCPEKALPTERIP